MEGVFSFRDVFFVSHDTQTSRVDESMVTFVSVREKGKRKTTTMKRKK